MNASGIQPVDVRILVKPDAAEEKTAGGIIIPDATKDRQKFATIKATVVAVGPNAFKDWGVGNGVEPGGRVYVAQYAGARVKGDDGEEYVLMNDEDVTAVTQ
jgi:chaperonin GroES